MYTGETEFSYGSGNASYTLKWNFHNELGLVFVAVHQRILSLTYVDDLLEQVKRCFTETHYDKTDSGRTTYAGFNDDLARLTKKAEANAAAKKAPKGAPKAFDAAKKAAKRNDASGKAKADPDDAASGAKGGGVGGDGDGEGATDSAARAKQTAAATAAFDISKLKKKGKGSKETSRKNSGTDLKSMADKDPSSDKDPAAKSPDAKPRKPKEKRVWVGEMNSGKNAKELDFSHEAPDKGGQLDAETERVDISKPSRIDDEEEEVVYSDDDSDSDGEDGDGNDGSDAAKKTKKKKSWLSGVLGNSLVQGVVGKSALDDDDLEPVLERLKTNFMNKNVAEDIAERLCESVAASLRGRKLASFSSLSAMVRSAMEEALTRILTPKRSVDILREVRAAKDAGKPYTIVFVGVNGVGKSTNLSKVAYWLLQHDVKVMIAACDTFRAGAVEQLRTHCKRLGVPLFERGYEKDPANVAAEAIKAAARQGCDAVLVDTAGRMQDNEPLMRALSKLINMNDPDLTLFVGEALVGNDAVDQLSKFNERLADLNANARRTKLIDGIVLSKFDTIDDKVGAALSMVYTSGAPVVFVGCGQTYTDLRRLNVKSVVKILLSSK